MKVTQFVFVVRVVQTEHRDAVLHRRELLGPRRTNAKGGGIVPDQVRESRLELGVAPPQVRQELLLGLDEVRAGVLQRLACEPRLVPQERLEAGPVDEPQVAVRARDDGRRPGPGRRDERELAHHHEVDAEPHQVDPGGDDGAAGLFAIKRRGGIAIVQDPNDALFPDMPRNALAATSTDYCVPKEDIANVIISLATARKSVETEEPMGEDEKIEKEAGLDPSINAAIIEIKERLYA